VQRYSDCEPSRNRQPDPSGFVRAARGGAGQPRITFVKGPDGKVDRLVLRQGGKELPAKRVK
jgi:hypothetical protein